MIHERYELPKCSRCRKVIAHDSDSIFGIAGGEFHEQCWRVRAGSAILFFMILIFAVIPLCGCLAIRLARHSPRALGARFLDVGPL